MGFLTPEWYKKAEQWFLEQGRPTISAGLAIVILFSVYFLYRMWHDKKDAFPAVVWLVYLLMP